MHFILTLPQDKALTSAFTRPLHPPSYIHTKPSLSSIHNHYTNYIMVKRSASESVAVPTPKMRKQAPVDDHKVAFAKKTASASVASLKASEPKSILKRPLRAESTATETTASTKPKATLSGAALLKANTKAASKTSSSLASLASNTSGSAKGGKPKGVVRQAVMASRGDVTGGMGRRKRQAPQEEEVNSGDDSDSENDGEDEEDSGDDEEEESDADDFEGMPATTSKSKDRPLFTLGRFLVKVVNSGQEKEKRSLTSGAHLFSLSRVIQEAH